MMWPGVVSCVTSRSLWAETSRGLELWCLVLVSQEPGEDGLEALCGARCPPGRTG